MSFDHRRLLLLVVFACIFSFPLARETDIDFWWHVRTGELIAHAGTVPTSDPFSYSASGHPWVVHEWLWDLGIFGIVGRGSYVLAVLLSACVITSTYIILYRLLRRLGANEIAASLFVLWAATLALPCIGVRPREFTFLFFAIYVSRLMAYRGASGESPRDRLAASGLLPDPPPRRVMPQRRGPEGGSRGALWLLPVLMLLWVNLHGGFVLGLGVLALCIAGEVWERWCAGRPLPLHLLAVGVATLVAAMLNPQGPPRLLYPFGYYLAQENPSFNIVTEFQSPSFHQPMSLVLLAGLLLFVLVGLPRRRPHVVEGLWAAVFIVQALVSVRQMSVAALLIAPLVVSALCERFRWMRELPPARLPPQLAVMNWIVLLLLVFAGVALALGPRVAPKLQLGREPKPGAMPVAGVQFIDEHDLPDPVFNDQGWGGYLIYRWYPRRKVFIDGRIDMYGKDVVGEYFELAAVRPEWQHVLDKYGVRTALVEKGSPMAVLLAASDGWERVFRGEVEEVFVRREAEHSTEAGQ